MVAAGGRAGAGPDVVHALAAALAVAALAGPVRAPQAGLLDTGRSLGGLRLGATPAQVREAWGGSFGRCRGCAEPTWYFNYVDFRPQGVAVSFAGGRVDALFTIWQPVGWHTTERLTLGDAGAQVTQTYGTLPTVDCGGYTAYLLDRAGARTVIYVAGTTVYGFALTRAGAPACR